MYVRTIERVNKSRKLLWAAIKRARKIDGLQQINITVLAAKSTPIDFTKAKV
jgi:hypothetical protein